MSTVIFLDIDGVLNNGNEIHEAGLYKDSKEPLKRYFSVRSYDLLKKIVEETSAEIVLSSTWRCMFVNSLDTPDYETGEILLNMFKERNIKLSGITGFEGHSRGEQILNFLKDHPNIKRYLVIDDDSFDIEGIIPDEKFVHTTFMEGLNEEKAEEAIRKINNQ